MLSARTMLLGQVANVAANLIAFLSLLELLNEILAWLGRMVGMNCNESLSLDGIDPTCDEELSFEKICSYLFVPLAWLLGVEPADCQDVAILLGKKTFINEFVAYIDLGYGLCCRGLDLRFLGTGYMILNYIC